MIYSTSKINPFTEHAAPVLHNGVVRTFRTTEGADRFLAAVGKRSTVGKLPTVCSTRASDVHKPSQRTGDRPECIRRLDVKSQLQVIRCEPPPNHYPPKIVKPAASMAA
jgi:hypothetical protein